MHPRKYNPGFLTDDELVESFCVRTNEFDSVLEVLRECTGNSNPHQLVIGPRGSGKTTLLLRVAVELHRDTALSSILFPVVLAEESYEVSSAGEFWLECLSRLATQAPCGDKGAPNLHRSYEELRTIRDDRTLAERCLGALLDFSDREGKRLVLIVENLNMMFNDMMDSNAGWRLRKILQTEPRIVLLASATSRFDEIDNPSQALYDLFRVSSLHPLNTSECAVLWETVTGKCRPPETIRSLEILTGGSPRLLAIVARFGTELSFRELMKDLLDLVDDHTEYFKSHLEALPAQERRVYLALADLWKPATTREVADRARLETSKCSAQLKRLIERGSVRVAGGTARRKQYYLTERLYNIYYLLRRSRGPDSLVDALVYFMESFYSLPEQWNIVARFVHELNSISAWNEPIHGVALEKFSNLPTMTEHLEEPMSAMTLYNTAIALQNQNRPTDALATYDKVIDQFGVRGAPHIQHTVARSLVNKGALLYETDRPEEALTVFDEVSRRFKQSSSSGILKAIANALVNKSTVLHELNRLEEALAVCDHVVSRFGANDTASGLDPNAVGQALVNKADILHDLKRSEEALSTYDEVVSRFDEIATDSSQLLGLVARSLVNKANVCFGLNRFEQALAICDEVVSRFRESDDRALLSAVGHALINRSIALDDARRPEEALTACDELVNLLGTSGNNVLLDFVAQAFLVKGSAFDSLNRTEQAIAAYDEVVTRFGNNGAPDLLEKVAIALFDKGNKLRDSERLEEALSAYDEVVRRFGEHGTSFFLEQVAKALVNKSIVLKNLGRSEDALAACDEVVSRLGKTDVPILLEPVGRALMCKVHLLENLNRPKEALSLCDDALTLYKKHNSKEFNTGVQLALVEKAGLELKIEKYEAVMMTVDRLLDPHLESSPENRSQAYLIRAIATIALDDKSASERNIRRSLDLLPETHIFSKSYLDKLMLFCARFGLARMHDIIQSSDAAYMLLPLSTALELELGREPRVAVEVLEVAHDVQRRLAKLSKPQARITDKEHTTNRVLASSDRRSA